MASVLHDRMVQAVGAIQADREMAAARIEEEKARVAKEAQRAIAEVQGQAETVLEGAAKREQLAKDEVAKTRKELRLQKLALEIWNCFERASVFRLLGEVCLRCNPRPSRRSLHHRYRPGL